MGVVANLIVRVGADIEGFEKKLASAEKLANRQGAKLQGIGSSLTTGLTLPIIGAGAAALKFSMDFNKSMANVASLMPGNTARIQELKKGVQQLSIQTGKSTSDMAGGLYQVVSAFGDSADSLSILNTNARAASAGLATTEEAINLTSAVTKGYGDTTAKAVAKAADLAQMTVRLGQTTFPELAASVGRVTPLTAELRVSQEELFAVMATGTGVTGKAAEVSTQLRGILQALMAPTADTTKLLGKMGVSSGKALIEQKGLHGAIQALVDAANRSGQPLQKYISSIEGQTLALALSGAQSDTYKQKLGQMGQAAGEVDRAFDAQTKGINAAGFEFEQLKRRVEVYLQRAGDRLAPAFLSAAEAMKPLLKGGEKLLEWFGNLPKPIQGSTLALLAVAAAAGPLFYVAGTLVKTYGALAGAAAWTSKQLGLSTLAKKAATVQAVGLSGSLRAATASFLGFAGAAAKATLITAAITALGWALWETAKGVRNLWAAWKEGKFLDTLFAKQDDNWLRRALGLTTTKPPPVAGSSGARPEPLAIPGLPDGWEFGLAGVGALGGGGGGDESPLQKRLEAIRESARGLITDAQAWASRVAELGGVTKAPESATKAFHGALQAVIESYGSLKAAGLSSLQALFNKTDAMVGKVADYKREFASLIATSPTAVLAGMPGSVTLLQDTFASPTPAAMDFRTSSRANLPIATNPLDVLGTIHQFPGAQLSKPPGGLSGFLGSAFGGGKGFAQSISGVMMSALTGGGNLGKSLGGFLGGSLTSQLAKGGIGKLLGGALGTALPGIGTALGAMAGPAISGMLGKIGGLFGFGESKKEKAAKETTAARTDFLAQIGGLDALKKKAEEVGFSLSTMLSTKDPKAFTAEVEKLNKAIEEKQKRWEGVAMAVDGVNARAAALMGPLQAQLATVNELKAKGQELFDSGSGSDIEANAEKRAQEMKRLSEMTKGAQAEFGRLGQFATAAFAGMIREGKTAMEAFAALSPTLDALATGVKDYGLKGTEAINRLLGMRELVKVHEAEFAALAANQQMLKGFGDAGLMTRDLFVAFGQDTAAQFDKIAKKGGDVSKAMALSQPVLQQLWEGQQKYGAFTDEATSKLLRQAEEQGLVGSHMKDVNGRILDVLLAIGDALGAKIPDALRTFRSVADSEGGRVIAKGQEIGEAWQQAVDDGIAAPVIGVFGRVRDSIGQLRGASDAHTAAMEAKWQHLADKGIDGPTRDALSRALDSMGRFTGRTDEELAELETKWAQIADKGIRKPMDEAFYHLSVQAKAAADDMQRKFDGIRARVPIEIQGGKIQFSGKGEENDYQIDVRGHSYREGTRGRYVDFGPGTLAMLHGEERISTKAEGLADAARDAALEQSLRSLAQAQRDLPGQIHQAVKDAVVLGGRV